MNFVSYQNMTELMQAIANNISATQGMTAPAFNANNSYAVGDLVTYQDGLYRFTSAHTSGDAWNVAEVSATTVEDLLDSAGVSGLTTAEVTALVALLN